MKRLPSIVGAMSIADYTVGQKVQTREGYPGRIDDIHEGPGDLTTYSVTLDNGMGGGDYAEAEIWPAEESRSAARIDASVEHTAADDYPELGSILSDRLPPQIVRAAARTAGRTDQEWWDSHSAEERKSYLDLTRFADWLFDKDWSDLGNLERTQLSHSRAEMLRHTPDREVYASRYDDSHEAPAWSSEAEEDDDYDDDLNYSMQRFSPERAAQERAAREKRTALTFDISKGDNSGPAATADPQEQKGYDDGVADARAGTTRNMQDIDPAYRAGYDRGWAFGVQQAFVPNGGGFVDSQVLDDQQVAGIPDQTLASKEGGLWDFVVGNPPPEKYKGHLSYDWCRYRRDAECYYSKDLNVEASKSVGYAVWEPFNRGRCHRAAWEDQHACEMAMPGPNVEGGFTDATVSWADGGQRTGQPTQTYRASTEGSAPSGLGFHLTASWKDIQGKAKRLRAAGGVRLIASQDNVVVGHVRGDTNVYETELVAVPGKRTVASWTCGCKWGSYSWGRSGPWKKFEGRMCSHALALSYEVSSRGMFGKDLSLDEKQPEWMDSSIPTRRPGDYDRSKGRYSSLSGEDRTYAALAAGRPVHDQDDAPAILSVVSLMLSEGVRYADIRTYAHACGVDNVPALVREARRTSIFPARVRGLFRELFIDDDGKVKDSRNSEEVSPEDVQHPAFDPRKGLDFRPRQATLVREAMPARVLQAPTLEAAAKAIIEEAQKIEPATTRLMEAEVKKAGGKMSGLDNRLKKQDSLLRKMKGEAAGRKPGDVAAGMSDVLRYTMAFGPGNYTDATNAVLKSLKAKGYKDRVKNYWGRGDAYNGINAALTEPGGFPLELQFHTDQSLVAKDLVHPIYDKWRKSTNEFERAKLGMQMRDIYDNVNRPDNALLVGTLKSQPKVVWKEWDWMKGVRRFSILREGVIGEPGPYRYQILDSGILIRFDIDDSVSEVWTENGWEVDAEYGKYSFLGATDSDEISEETALDMTGEVPISHLATLDDDPEAALPITYGEDDDDTRKVGDSLPDGLYDQIVALTSGRETFESLMATEPPTTDLDEPMDAADLSKGAALVAQVDAFNRGEISTHPFAHMRDSGSDDVQAAAKAFLSKTALKSFTPAERQQFIDEGEAEGVTASNFDKMDISGTHYEALEMTQAKKDRLADVDDSWLMDGDPNG